MHLLLWAAQVILAASFSWAAGMKLFQPIETLAVMWPWAGQVPVSLVKGTGIVDLLGAVGLILPALFRLKPLVTPLAASCLVVLMVCAGIFHLVRGEASQIGTNVFFAVMAAFVAWGRVRKAPISSR
ncbi:DoxX family protein [Larkinella arboricola]|nr:DoxX family protein [Larkinella arboricola]